MNKPKENLAMQSAIHGSLGNYPAAVGYAVLSRTLDDLIAAARDFGVTSRAVRRLLRMQAAQRTILRADRQLRANR